MLIRVCLSLVIVFGIFPVWNTCLGQGIEFSNTLHEDQPHYDDNGIEHIKVSVSTDATNVSMDDKKAIMYFVQIEVLQPDGKWNSLFHNNHTDNIIPGSLIKIGETNSFSNGLILNYPSESRTYRYRGCLATTDVDSNGNTLPNSTKKHYTSWGIVDIEIGNPDDHGNGPGGIPNPGDGGL